MQILKRFLSLGRHAALVAAAGATSYGGVALASEIRTAVTADLAISAVIDLVTQEYCRARRGEDLVVCEELARKIFENTARRKYECSRIEDAKACAYRVAQQAISDWKIAQGQAADSDFSYCRDLVMKDAGRNGLSMSAVEALRDDCVVKREFARKLEGNGV